MERNSAAGNSYRNVIEGNIPTKADIVGSVSVGSISTKSYDVYDGTYTVVPKPKKEQVLQTSGKLLLKNIIIKEIPYYKVSNKSGKTVYIGKEIITNGD